MKKNDKTVVTIWLILATSFCFFLCFIFDVGRIRSGLVDFFAKSPPGKWTISGFSRISELSSIDNFLYFRGYKADQSVDCICIYAADKSTSNIVWSTETLAKPLIEKFRQSEIDSHRIASITDIISVAPAEHRIYITINDSFFVLNSSDGTVIWESGTYMSSLKITDTEVILINEKQSTVAYDKKSGRILWEQPASYVDKNFSRLALQNSTVYERFQGGKQHFLLALNRITGKKNWQVPIRDFNYGPVFFENTLIICQFDQWGNTNYLTAYDSESGSLIWEMEFLGTFDYPRIEAIDRQILLLLEKPIPERHEEYLNYVDAKTGELLWSFTNDLQYGEIHYKIHGEQLFVITSGKKIFSLDLRTGQIAWSNTLEGEPTYLIQNQSILLVTTDNNQISAYDANTGAKIWTAASDIYNKLFIADDEAENLFRVDSGKLFIAGQTPLIKIFDIQTGKQIGAWKHNDRYQWLLNAHYGLGLYDGQFLYVTGDDGRFSEVGSDFDRILRVNLEELMQ